MPRGASTIAGAAGSIDKGDIAAAAASGIAVGAGQARQAAQTGAGAIAGQIGGVTLFGGSDGGVAGGVVVQPEMMKKSAKMKARCRVKIALLFFID